MEDQYGLMFELQPITVVLIFANHEVLLTSSFVNVGTSDNKVKKLALKHYRKNHKGLPDPIQIIISRPPAIRAFTESNSLMVLTKNENQEKFIAQPDFIFPMK